MYMWCRRGVEHMEGDGRMCVCVCIYIWVLYLCVWCAVYVCMCSVCVYVHTCVSVAYILHIWFGCSVCRKEERTGCMCLCWEIWGTCIVVSVRVASILVCSYKGIWYTAHACKAQHMWWFPLSLFCALLPKGRVSNWTRDAHWLGQASWPAISQDLPPSIPQPWDCSQLCPAFPAAAGCWKPGPRLPEFSTLIIWAICPPWTLLGFAYENCCFPVVRMSQPIGA